MNGFSPGSFVILNLVNPREKFWGALISLGAVGVTLRGINLDSFEDWVRQVARQEEEPTLDLVSMFVPLFRVERIFLDEPVGTLQSYSKYFKDLVGASPEEYLGVRDIEEEDSV